MRVMAFNGSPRKKWNTAQLLQSALNGAAEAWKEQGLVPETELVHLYDLDYQGCISCFSCKKVGSKGFGRCAVRDGLTPVLERALESDVILLGSPVYFHSQSSAMRAFLERLLFPLLDYVNEPSTLPPRPLRVASFYTMNVPEERLSLGAFPAVQESMDNFIRRVFGNARSLCSTDTLQFNDYSKYVTYPTDPEHKRRRNREVFPQDLQVARDMGATLAGEALADLD